MIFPSNYIAKDYYPFGMGMPGRSWNIGEENYRYGFNGKENTDEIYGNGNALDFGARIYDARLGRWLSVDPLQMKFSDLSPYLGLADNPILYIDPDGKIFQLSGDENPQALINVINSAFSNQLVAEVITNSHGNSFLRINLAEGVDFNSLSRTEQATYLLMKSMISSKKLYTLKVEKPESKDIRQQDLYAEGEIYPSNFEGLATSGGYGQLEVLYHVIGEQKFKQDDPTNFEYVEDGYLKHHQQTLDLQEKEIGIKWGNEMLSTDNSMMDLDIMGEGNTYINTIRFSKDENGEWTGMSPYLRDGLQSGTVINPTELNQQSDEETGEYINRTNEHFKNNQ